VSLQADRDKQFAQQDSVDSELRAIDQQQQPFKAQMDRIERTHPSLVLPPSVFEEYEEARSQWNSLNEQRNQVVEGFNATVAQQEETTGAYNDVVAELNGLKDELAWLP
jgi:chromosome segregation ATPase